jgi:hypothetical protein
LALALGFARSLGFGLVVVHCVIDLGKLIAELLLDLDQGIFYMPTVAGTLRHTGLVGGNV